MPPWIRARADLLVKKKVEFSELPDSARGCDAIYLGEEVAARYLVGSTMGRYYSGTCFLLGSDGGGVVLLEAVVDLGSGLEALCNERDNGEAR